MKLLKKKFKIEEILNTRKNILFITPSVQMEKSSGGGKVTIERLNALVLYHNVTVLTMSVDDTARQYFSGVSWHVNGSLKSRNPSVLLKSYFKGLPLSVFRNTANESINVARGLSKVKWDLIYIDHWLMIEVAGVIKNCYSILNLHNAEPEVFFSASKTANNIKKIFMLIEGYRSATYLQKKISNFNCLHLLSNDDAAKLKIRGISHPNTKVFLPSVNKPNIEIAPIENRRHEVLFIGTLSWYANEEGIIWYIKNVLNYLDSYPTHQIIGSGASENLTSMVSKIPEISALGYVDNLEPFYQSAKCLIAPLKSGSGIKIKIIDALARGLPIVTTPIGIEGFPPGYQESIFVTNTPKEFAKAIESITNDDQLWANASKNALNYFNEHFSGIVWKNWSKELIL